jgi:hypothetical protein
MDIQSLDKGAKSTKIFFLGICRRALSELYTSRSFERNSDDIFGKDNVSSLLRDMVVTELVDNM